MPTKAIMMCFLAMVTIANTLVAAPQADFYVAPTGNDAWSGKIAARNAGGTDGPFASPARAQLAVRALRRVSPGLQRPVVVMLRGGMYYIDKALSITPVDSGTPASPTVFAAYPGEKPVISGGAPVVGWQKGAEGRWQVQLPQVQQGKWTFTQLWVNGERRYRPRFPEDGYFRIEKPLVPSSGGKDAPPDRFKYPEGAFDPAWPDLSDADVLVFHYWTMDRMKVKSIDEARRAVTFTSPTLSNNVFFDLQAGRRFIVENVAAAFTRPGTWYLDRKSGTIGYIPLPGEDLAKAVIIAPRLERVLQLRGEPEIGLCVENVVFRGLTFAHTNWVTPTEGYKCGQSESVLSGAITADGARNCLFDGCTVTHVGTFGIELLSGCQENRIENCEITDAAAGGIKIGEMGMRNDDALLTSHNTVRNNLIAHLGRMHAAGPGVWIGHSPYNVVEHNEIADLYQLGISVGWSWGYGPSQAHDNRIAYNLIHDVGQGVTSDIGGIYTLGVSPGTVIENNVIHDVSCDEYGGRGLYSDEGSSDILLQNNVVYRTDTGAFMHHYGRENRVINNVFALARGGQLDRLREEPHQSFTFERNIVYYDQTGYLLAENWSNEHFAMDHNLYWNCAGQPVSFAGQTLAQWQKRGHDTNSRIADPLFVDPQHGDFALKPGSSAFDLGIKPIDTSTVGRIVDGHRRAEEPLAPRAFPPKPSAWQMQIDEDFEDTNVGEPAAGAVTNEENGIATIRVTDETAASGKHSLKFIDMPGQKYNYKPHMYWTPNRTEGLVREHFDLRVEPGFQFYHEWRDVTVFFRSGPTFTLFEDGSLTVGGKKLATLPHGKWMGFDITCGLGKQATGTWELAVSVPGQEPLKFPGLTYDPEFKAVHWLLFGAHGDQAAVAYLDNVRLK